MGNLDLQGKGACSEAGPGTLGLQQRFWGKSLGLRIGCWGPREAMVGKPGVEKSGLGRNGAQGNFRHQEEEKKLWNGD